jgi:hypothetical protein
MNDRKTVGFQGFGAAWRQKWPNTWPTTVSLTDQEKRCRNLCPEFSTLKKHGNITISRGLSGIYAQNLPTNSVEEAPK